MVFSNKMIRSILEGYLFDEDIWQGEKFRCGFNELVKGITIELNAMADTKQHLLEIADKEQTLKAGCKEACDKLKTRRDELILGCQHHSTTSFPDVICNTCGKKIL